MTGDYYVGWLEGMLASEMSARRVRRVRGLGLSCVFC